MADYYGTAAGFTAYHAARDNEVPGAPDDPTIVAALLVASEWIDGRYLAAFAATTFKTGGRDQLREWPRNGFVDIYGYPIGSTVVPREVENATYEAALRQITTAGSLLSDYTPSKYKSVKVDGAISVEYTAFGGGYDAQAQYLVIDQILAPLLTAPGAHGDHASFSGRVVRA